MQLRDVLIIADDGTGTDSSIPMLTTCLSLLYLYSSCTCRPGPLFWTNPRLHLSYSIIILSSSSTRCSPD